MEVPSGEFEDVDISNTAHLVALASLPGMGPSRLRATLSHTEAKDAWRLLCEAGRVPDATMAVSGVTPDLVAGWCRRARALDVARLWKQHDDLGIDVLTSQDPTWPIDDATDPDPPIVLFGSGPVRGRPRPCVAIVGTRRCTRYGAKVAAELAAGLAERGVAVISGLASGIDGAAQRAAFDTGGEVIAVVGSGLDVVYPFRNRLLWREIMTAGRMWTESPLGGEPARWRFPARNRIIAAMADIVVVVESGPSGGSLHTVDAALDRDRPVMAVPGPITSWASTGTNRLLAQGCAPVTDVDDIVAALGLCVANIRTVVGPTKPEVDDPLQQLVLEAVGIEATSVDEIVTRSGVDVGTTLAALGHLRALALVVDSGGWWERA